MNGFNFPYYTTADGSRLNLLKVDALIVQQSEDDVHYYVMIGNHTLELDPSDVDPINLLLDKYNLQF